MINFKDSLAERSKAIASDAILKERGFESLNYNFS